MTLPRIKLVAMDQEQNNHDFTNIKTRGGLHDQLLLETISGT